MPAVQMVDMLVPQPGLVARNEDLDHALGGQSWRHRREGEIGDRRIVLRQRAEESIGLLILPLDGSHTCGRCISRPGCSPVPAISARNSSAKTTANAWFCNSRCSVTTRVADGGRCRLVHRAACRVLAATSKRARCTAAVVGPNPGARSDRTAGQARQIELGKPSRSRPERRAERPAPTVARLAAAAWLPLPPATFSGSTRAGLARSAIRCAPQAPDNGRSARESANRRRSKPGDRSWRRSPARAELATASGVFSPDSAGNSRSQCNSSDSFCARSAALALSKP